MRRRIAALLMKKTRATIVLGSVAEWRNREGRLQREGGGEGMACSADAPTPRPLGIHRQLIDARYAVPPLNDA